MGDILAESFGAPSNVFSESEFSPELTPAAQYASLNQAMNTQRLQRIIDEESKQRGSRDLGSGVKTSGSKAGRKRKLEEEKKREKTVLGTTSTRTELKRETLAERTQRHVKGPKLDITIPMLKSLIDVFSEAMNELTVLDEPIPTYTINSVPTLKKVIGSIEKEQVVNEYWKQYLKQVFKEYDLYRDQLTRCDSERGSILNTQDLTGAVKLRLPVNIDIIDRINGNRVGGLEADGDFVIKKDKLKLSAQPVFSNNGVLSYFIQKDNPKITLSRVSDLDEKFGCKYYYYGSVPLDGLENNIYLINLFIHPEQVKQLNKSTASTSSIKPRSTSLKLSAKTSALGRLAMATGSKKLGVGSSSSSSSSTGAGRGSIKFKPGLSSSSSRLVGGSTSTSVSKLGNGYDDASYDYNSDYYDGYDGRTRRLIDYASDEEGYDAYAQGGDISDEEDDFEYETNINNEEFDDNNQDQDQFMSDEDEE